MTEKEYLEALKENLIIGDEENRATVLRFCEEMIDDRMESGFSEEEAVAAMEDVRDFAARMNSEYEEMVSGSAESDKNAQAEASGENGTEDFGKIIGDAAEKAGQFISDFASAVKKSIREAREAVRADSDEDSAEQDLEEFVNGAEPENGTGTETFGEENAPEEKKEQPGVSAEDAAEAIRKLAGKVKRFVKPILRDTRDTLQKYVNGEPAAADGAETDDGSTWKQEEMSVPAAEICRITLNAKNFAVRVRPHAVDAIRLVYWTREKTPYTATAENGELLLTGGQDNHCGVSFSLQDLLNGKTWKEIFGGAHGDIELYLPENAAADLTVNTSNGAFSAENTSALKHVNVHTSNGRVSLSSLTCDAFNVRTSNAPAELNDVKAENEAVAESSNGAINAQGLNAGEVRVRTSNGAVALDNVSARGILTAVTSNARCSATHSVCEGDLTLQSSNGPVRAEICDCAGFTAITSNGGLRAEGINACAYTLRTSNASVTGTLPGSMERYGISSQTSNGKNSLPAFSEGEIPLKVNTSNGSIQISFAG